MKVYIKAFLHRGLIFSGFGPIIASIVYLCLSLSIPDFMLTGTEMFVAILSTYLLAFIHAGSSVFHQIESWPVARSLFCHSSILYVTYVVCYLINAWIPFDPLVIAIFTALFIATYFVVWGVVVICIKVAGNALNQQLLK